MYDSLKDKQVDDDIQKMEEKIDKNARYGCKCGTKKHSEFSKFSDVLSIDTTYFGAKYYDILVEYCPSCGVLFSVEEN